MKLVSVEPQRDLQQVVRKFWYATAQTSDTSQVTYKILSDGAPGIIFQHCSGQSALLETDGRCLPISFVYGQSTQPCINHLTQSALIVGASLQPTALKKLFNLDASEFTNSLWETGHFFSRAFMERLLHISNPQLIIQLISGQLRLRLPKGRQDRMIDESIRLIIQKNTNFNSKVLAEHFNISRRQFQRKFKEYAGVCPETYLRIIKFQKSLHFLMSRQYEKLSDIAYMLNYADQSHFVREFKLFSSWTPKKFLQTVAKQSTFLKDTTGRFEGLRIVED